MFSRKRNLLFVFNEEKRISLHNFFVFFPIDLVFLDKNGRVIEIKRNFKPFTFYKSKNKAKYVLELTEKNNLKVGNGVELNNKKI